MVPYAHGRKGGGGMRCGRARWGAGRNMREPPPPNPKGGDGERQRADGAANRATVPRRGTCGRRTRYVRACDQGLGRRLPLVLGFLRTRCARPASPWPTQDGRTAMHTTAAVPPTGRPTTRPTLCCPFPIGRFSIGRLRERGSASQGGARYPEARAKASDSGVGDPARGAAAWALLPAVPLRGCHCIDAAGRLMGYE